jgi:hypothetical protein
MERMKLVAEAGLPNFASLGEPVREKLTKFALFIKV